MLPDRFERRLQNATHGFRTRFTAMLRNRDFARFFARLTVA